MRLDQRVRKSGPTSLVPSGMIDMVYDEQGRLLGEYDANGNVLQETVYLDGMPVAVLKSATTPQGDRVSEVYYVYADHLDTTRIITRTSDNQVIWRWDSADPFGITLPDENPSGLGSFRVQPAIPRAVLRSRNRVAS